MRRNDIGACIGYGLSMTLPLPPFLKPKRADLSGEEAKRVFDREIDRRLKEAEKGDLIDADEVFRKLEVKLEKMRQKRA